MQPAVIARRRHLPPSGPSPDATKGGRGEWSGMDGKCAADKPTKHAGQTATSKTEEPQSSHATLSSLVLSQCTLEPHAGTGHAAAIAALEKRVDCTTRPTAHSR
jgi:hypothetical protein